MEGLVQGLVQEVERQIVSRCSWVRHVNISVEGRRNSNGNVILLTGCARNYYQKQMVQEAALKVLRRENVELLNEIDVV